MKPRPPLPPIANDLFAPVKVYFKKLYDYLISVTPTAGKGIRISHSLTGASISVEDEDYLINLPFYGSFGGFGQRYTNASRAWKLKINPGKWLLGENTYLFTQEETDLDVTAITYVDDVSFVWIQLDNDTGLLTLESGDYPGVIDPNAVYGTDYFNWLIGRVVRYTEASEDAYEWFQHWTNDIENIGGSETLIANCTLPQAEDAVPLTEAQQDAIAPGVYANEIDGVHVFSRLQAEVASSGQAVVPVTLDDTGCIIKIGAVDIPGKKIPGVNVDFTVKGDQVWTDTIVKNIQNIPVTQVFHINEAPVTWTHTFAVDDVIGGDDTGHILEINGTRVIPYRPPVVVIPDNPYIIPTDDEPTIKIEGVLIEGHLFDTGTTTTPGELCAFEDYDLLFELEKPVSTTYSGYNGKTGVIQGVELLSGDFVKFYDGAGIVDELSGTIGATSGGGNGIEYDVANVLLPPSSYISGSSQIKITYNVPIVGLVDTETFSICPLESTLRTKAGSDPGLVVGQPATYDFFISDNGASFGVHADFTGRYRIELNARKQSTNELVKAEIVDTWEGVSPAYAGYNISITWAEMSDLMTAGDTLCLTAKVYDLVFNEYVTAWEQTDYREMTGGLTLTYTSTGTNADSDDVAGFVVGTLNAVAIDTQSTGSVGDTVGESIG